ncbi:PD-(D/E)XK motif protein [Paracoccus seriniphilus]|uniref:Putative PD-(D/E)XK family member n=1 Tax=Paracoccus seriniphilus TaxID=184748 RepID=A0A239PMD3_9RHOB|nr:PD-(D/E)XK motif protein [Paracoccus seriniphilus]WCR13471.1 PD-(D/E)XK motif protein [Paracoccus seriniphilus]SNT68952.1 Putative PD-(D/E)XK family member [Paracoccus seriniphilus]
MPDGARKIWSRLRSSEGGDGKLEVPSLSTRVETGFGPALYAIGPSGEPRLLVPFGKITPPKDLGSGPNLFAGVSTFKMDSRSVSFIDLMVTDRKLDNVFVELAGEILKRLREGQAPTKAVSGTISDFRALLMGRGRKDPSSAEVMGLVGELLILKRIVDLKPGAISSWTGPFGQRHDFRSGARAIEVKTSGRADAGHLGINGILQLDPPEGGTLLLTHVRLERAEEGTLSVSGLCKSIIEAGADSHRLTEALGKLGCDAPDDDRWNRTRFSFEGLDIYRVEPGFPRLTPDDFLAGVLPAGVAKLSYEIDLSHARDFLVPHEDMEKLLKGFPE